MNNSLNRLKPIFFKKIIPVILIAFASINAGSEQNFASAAQQKFSEYHIKAEFLERITRFIEWPKEIFSDSNKPFIVTLVGKNPFGTYLKKLVKVRKVQGHRIILRQTKDYESIKNSHMIFISKSENKRLNEILSITANLPILVVGDGENLARRGAHIALYKKNKRIRFNINISAARKSGLVISSKLLRLATLVCNEGKK